MRRSLEFSRQQQKLHTPIRFECVRPHEKRPENRLAFFEQVLQSADSRKNCNRNLEHIENFH